MHSLCGTLAEQAEFGLLNELAVMQLAQKAATSLYLPDTKVEALYGHADLLWRRIASEPVQSRYDAAAKLELLIFDYDEGREPLDPSISMVRQVERWLRTPSVWRSA